MSEIHKAILVTTLEKKGFKLKEGHNHKLYYFHYEGKRTSIRVTISRGNKSYGDELMKWVYQGMSLNKAQFLEFIECTMSEAKYIEHLKEKKLIG